MKQNSTVHSARPTFDHGRDIHPSLYAIAVCFTRECSAVGIGQLDSEHLLRQQNS
jgi:hypothetical protein